MTTLVLKFKKVQSDDKTLRSSFYSNLKEETIVNNSDIDDVFKSIYSTIILNIDKFLEQSSGWIIDSVIDHNISKHNHLAGRSYIKLPNELDHPTKFLINIQNIDDNKCFKWFFLRYLYPADHHPVRITKAEKYFFKKLDFKT